ncbi:MAG: TolC family protein [Planctomycetaceae bacterium]|jgi:outer membrane protein TolC|nr:TolC family protein [Planctomycetaceae bacterium]
MNKTIDNKLFNVFIWAILVSFFVVLVLPLFAQTALLPPPPLPPISHPTPRAPGQKYIEEIWDELENATFATPTFEELGTLHEGHSFDELWELAQTSNPSLHKKINQIKYANGQRIQAGLYPNPRLNYAGDNLGVHGEIGKHGFGITQEIITAKKKKFDRSIASYNITTARKEYSMEYIKLRNDLSIAHNEMIHAILIWKVEEFAYEISTDLLKVAQELQKDNKTRSLDVLHFRTELNESALHRRQAENNKIAKWQNIISIIGKTHLPYQPVRGSLIDRTPRRNWQSTWTQFQNTSPQLELLKLKIAQARTQLAREKAEQTPNVAATFSLARDVPAKTTTPFVGISVPLQIYDKNQGNIIKAGAEVAIANQELDRVTLSFHKKLSDIFYKYDSACELIQAYEKSIIPDSFEALRQIGENYCDGKMTYHDLYSQRQLVIKSLLQYIDALKIKAITTIQIDGMLLEGTLD